jgi:hypothetical protein
MRVAIHAVHVMDYPDFHRAMQTSLRAARLKDRRFAAAGVSIEEADALVPSVVDFLAEPRGTPEVERWLDDRLGTPPSRARIWWAMRHYGPFVHAPTRDPWSFGYRNRYQAAPREAERLSPPAALARLIRRYLEGFGPATVQDFRQFALVYMPLVKAALALLGDELVSLAGPEGSELIDVRGAPVPDEGVSAPPRLLGMWDNTLLAYADRGRIIPPDHRRLVVRSNGDVLPTILVGGYVAGVWRHVDDAIEISAFEPLSDEAWTGLATEARSLLKLLGPRAHRVFGRYGRWWKTLPGSIEVERILG